MYFYLMTPMGSSGEATDPRYVLMRQSRPSFLIAKQLQFQNRWWFTWDLNPGRRMVGSDETTELWRPSIQDILVPIHTRLLRLLSRIKHYGPWALVNPIKTIMVRGLKRTGCGYRLWLPVAGCGLTVRCKSIRWNTKPVICVFGIASYIL